MIDLLFLGDSITDCDHSFDIDCLGNGYVRMIAEQLGYGYEDVSIKNMGCNGFTVRALHRLWKQFCTEFNPDCISILIGINDIGLIKNTGLSEKDALDEFRENYAALLQDIRNTHNCPILLLEPFVFQKPAEFAAWEPLVLQINQIIHALANEYQLTFVPLWDELKETVKWEGFDAVTTDGIHLTKIGHEILKETWLDYYYQIQKL